MRFITLPFLVLRYLFYFLRGIFFKKRVGNIIFLEIKFTYSNKSILKSFRFHKTLTSKIPKHLYEFIAFIVSLFITSYDLNPNPFPWRGYHWMTELVKDKQVHRKASLPKSQDVRKFLTLLNSISENRVLWGITRENLKYREWLSPYTYCSHLVDTSVLGLCVHIWGSSIPSII